MSTSSPANSDIAIEVFVSYAHKDEQFRLEMDEHLSVLERQGLIRCWYDGDIRPGTEWDETIKTRLESAPIILLLISASFINSDYCYGIELQRAMERHEASEARVVPVIIREVDWTRAPFARLQALPAGGKAIASAHWHDRDAAWADVVKGIREVVEEMRARPAAAPVKSQPVWNVPYRLSPHFAGRDALLESLRSELLAGKESERTQALTGLGGVGKTQLALAYATRYRNEYDVVWWIKSEKTATLADDYAELAVALNLPERDSNDQRLSVAAVRRWLERNGNWLLVFDNAREPEQVRDFLPRLQMLQTGHILITSRHRDWSEITTELPVPELEGEQAVDFLLRRTEEDDRGAAAELAVELGCLPLALEHAGAYIRRVPGVSLRKYLELFRERSAELMRRDKPPADYDGTVATTWTVSFQEAGKESAAAVELLSLFSFLAADDIPRDLLSAGAELLPAPLAVVVRDELALNDAEAALRHYSLIEADETGWSVHRLVQTVARGEMAEEERRRWAEVAVRLVGEQFPYQSDAAESRSVCARLIMHALSATAHAESLGVARPETARLLNQVAGYMNSRALFAKAKEAFERALLIVETEFGAADPIAAICLNNLALVRQSLGEYALAERDYARALAIVEKESGAEHPDVAAIVNGLGAVLYEQGNFAAARDCHERALRIYTAHDDAGAGVAANNLGADLRKLGDYAGAVAVLKRARWLNRAIFGATHPNVATGYSHFGDVRSDLGLQARERGDHALAEACWRKAQTWFERTLKLDELNDGARHPNLAAILGKLGKLAEIRGDAAAACDAHRRAYSILRECLGDGHPRTLAVKERLAALECGKQTESTYSGFQLDAASWQ